MDSETSDHLHHCCHHHHYHSLGSWPCAKYLTYIISLNPHQNSIGKDYHCPDMKDDEIQGRAVFKTHGSWFM